LISVNSLAATRVFALVEIKRPVIAFPPREKGFVEFRFDHGKTLHYVLPGKSKKAGKRLAG
jgi:hypothetical protein